MKKIELSLILPCYNEAEHFETSIVQIQKALEKVQQPFEIVFVEDNSTDDTKRLLKKYIARAKHSVQRIFHNTNQGRGKSVADGIYISKGKYVGFIDIDCEVSPDYILHFIQALNEGNDVVCADRKYPFSGSGFIRLLASNIYRMLVQIILGIPLRDSEAGYKFFRKAAILPVLKTTTSTGWFWDTEIMARAHAAGLQITFLPVAFKRRIDKTSTVRIIPDTLDYIYNLLRFRLYGNLKSSKPQL